MGPKFAQSLWILVDIDRTTSAQTIHGYLCSDLVDDTLVTVLQVSSIK